LLTITEGRNEVTAVKLNDFAVLMTVEADEACRARIEESTCLAHQLFHAEESAEFCAGECWKAALLRGPGNEAIRTKRLRDAFADVYSAAMKRLKEELLDCYAEHIESARLEAALARASEMDAPSVATAMFTNGSNHAPSA
jgi:hypothetical protein